MTQTTNTQGQLEQHPVNLAIKFQGYLGHDNKYFDRTCPNCKGYHCSYHTATCPECGAQLTYITTGKGTRMGISEGSIYTSLPSKQKERDIVATKANKNGMEPKYRFKLFSFADENGVLAPHPAHGFCKEGAMIEIITINHQPVFKWFMGKDKETGQQVAKVEMMMNVFDNYGDKVTLLRGPKKNAALTTTVINPDGTPASLPPIYNPPAQAGQQINGDLAGVLAAMKAQIEQITAQLGVNPAQPAPQPAAPQPQAPVSSPGDSSVDPFAGAL